MPMNDNQPYDNGYAGVMGSPAQTASSEEFEYMKKIVKRAFHEHTIKEAAKEYEL